MPRSTRRSAYARAPEGIRTGPDAVQHPGAKGRKTPPTKCATSLPGGTLRAMPVFLNLPPASTERRTGLSPCGALHWLVPFAKKHTDEVAQGIFDWRGVWSELAPLIVQIHVAGKEKAGHDA